MVNLNWIFEHWIEIFIMLVLIGSILGGIWNWGGIVKNSERSFAFIISLLVFTTVPIIIEKVFSDLPFKKNVTTSLTEGNAEIVNILMNGGHLKVIGEASDAAKEVSQKLGNVLAGYNTYIVEEEPYDEDTDSQITGAIVGLLMKRNTVWYEILSEEGKGRITKIAQNLNGKLSARNYRACVISEKFKNFPVLNFVVLKNFDKSQEVYFGWGFKSQRASDYVFWSNNPKIVDFFIRYHEELRQEPICQKG